MGSSEATDTNEWRRLLGGLRNWYRLLGAASPGARLIEGDGVMAAVVPAAARRSVMNAVVYDDVDRLEAALPTLSDAYADAGVAAWTVWVPLGDPGAARLLEEHGHSLDASPAAMLRELEGVRRPGGGALDEWTARGDIGLAGRINDGAFPFGDASFERALGGLASTDAHVYVGSVDGEAVAAALVSDHEGNAEVDGVAVLPGARGRGLSGELLGHALADARDRGLDTTTLIATALGRPVYERLGYRELGPVEMWERRTAEGARR